MLVEEPSDRPLDPSKFARLDGNLVLIVEDRIGRRDCRQLCQNLQPLCGGHHMKEAAAESFCFATLEICTIGIIDERQCSVGHEPADGVSVSFDDFSVSLPRLLKYGFRWIDAVLLSCVSDTRFLGSSRCLDV